MCASPFFNFEIDIQIIVHLNTTQIDIKSKSTIKCD